MINVNNVENSNVQLSDKQKFIVSLESEVSKASLFRFELIFSTLTVYNREKAQELLQKDSYFRLSTVVSVTEDDLPIESERGEKKSNIPKTRDVELWMKKGNEKNKENEEEQDCLP